MSERVRAAHETDAARQNKLPNICDYITSSYPGAFIHLACSPKRLGYTEYYFSHKFKDVMGKSVNNYIRQKKTEEAKLLLSGTRMSIFRRSAMSCPSAAAVTFFPASRRKPACHRQNTGSSMQNPKKLFAVSHSLIRYLRGVIPYFF